MRNQIMLLATMTALIFGFINRNVYAESESSRHDVYTDEKIRSMAQSGDAKAQYQLGNMYWTGTRVAKDSSEAIKWFRKAADQGLAEAQRSLGVMYQKGEGVEKSMSEAIKWFRKAADQGDAAGQFMIGATYAMGQGIDRDYAEAVKWFRKSAEQGHHHAQGSLGGMYFQGHGLDKDYVEGYKWMILASRGFKTAIPDKTTALLTSDQIAEAQRRADAFIPRKEPTK